MNTRPAVQVSFCQPQFSNDSRLFIRLAIAVIQFDVRLKINQWERDSRYCSTRLNKKKTEWIGAVNPINFGKRKLSQKRVWKCFQSPFKREREKDRGEKKRSRDIRIGEKFMVEHRCDRIAFTGGKKKRKKRFEIDDQLRLYWSIDIIPSRLGFHQTYRRFRNLEWPLVPFLFHVHTLFPDTLFKKTCIRYQMSIFIREMGIRTEVFDEEKNNSLINFPTLSC